jgi:hypothetical protein
MRALLFFTHRRFAGVVVVVVARRTVVITVVVVPHPIDAFDDIMFVVASRNERIDP